ncbi:MAG: hypothetical protein ABFD04_00690 [Syntrophomonas sp.]
MDHEDSDLTIFYSHLLEMLFPPHDDFSQEAHEHFDKCGNNLSEYQCLNALLCQELWASHSLYPDAATYMVFDDFHEVMESPQIMDTIQFFIDNVPPNYKI